jgi:hypothetical protein
LRGCPRRGGRVTGVTPNLAGGQFTGFVNKFAWNYGVGFQYSISPSLGIRFDTNYLHTAYFISSGAIQGQQNLQTVVEILWYFGKRKKF